MASDQKQQTDFASNKSVDSLLNEMKNNALAQDGSELNHAPQVTSNSKATSNNKATSKNKTTAKDKRQNMQSQRSRRKNVDRRDSAEKLPKGTAERRDDLNRRGQKSEAIKNREELERLQNEVKLQQHRKKILLAGCEPVMGFNFENLALDDYPDNALVSAARHDRDIWLTICVVFSSLFFFGVLDLVSAWLAGIGSGLAFISAVFAFSPARKYFFQRPHLHKLLSLRKRLEFSALNHIQYLEGYDGLAWRCFKLAKYNSNLNNKLFSGLYHYSEERQMLNVIQNKKHIRLYLLLMIESQKAYKRLEKDYLEHHFKHIDDGWDDRIDAAEAEELKQSLNTEINEDKAPKDS